ncbi:MAG TPA: NAD(P)-dependent oxidoreductase [Burkholderiales bacterium]|nr:NAD(P)-dependent oxidoreductase [Burkholderiales bacterium]
MNLGFIGLGQMGRPMVERLKGAGHSLKVYNRTRSSQEIASKPDDVLDAQIVITMLADDAAVRAVWLDSGLARRLPKGAIHLNMATVSMSIARQLTEIHGDKYLAAPVFGRPPLAAQGQLDIIAAGPKAALERCEPLFKVLGKQTFVVGEEPAKANAVKIARNFLLATVIESLGEAFALVRKCGVEPQKFLEILGNTSLGSPAYKNYGKMIVEQAWTPAQFAMPLGVKDVELALATAREAGMNLPSGELIRKNLLAAIAAGRAEQDWAALAGKLAADAGL